MAIDFSKIDNQLNVSQLQKEIAEAKANGGSFQEIPAGVYSCKLEKLELGATSPAKGSRPMLKAMFRIIGDEDQQKCEYTRSCLFFNRVIYGTKDDANMIAGALTWLESLDPSEDVGPIVFNSYAAFADLVMDIAEDVSDLIYIVDYDPSAFNSISISDVLE